MSGNLQWLLKEVEKAMEKDKEFCIRAECEECKKLDEGYEEENHD